MTTDTDDSTIQTSEKSEVSQSESLQHESEQPSATKSPTESNLLTSEEVDALLNMARVGNVSHLGTDQGGPTSEWKEDHQLINQKILNNIIDMTSVEMACDFTAFIRKKIEVSNAKIKMGRLDDCIKLNDQKFVYTIFHVKPYDAYGMVAISYAMLHHTINLLFGGKVDPEDKVIEKAGKLGVIVAEKLSTMALNAYSKAAHEYGEMECEVIKTVLVPNLTSKLNLDETVTNALFPVYFADIETHFSISFQNKLFVEFIPGESDTAKHIESSFWRSAVEQHVGDASVEVRVTMQNVNMKLSEILNCKPGDLIPIGEPTLTYMSLNNIRLYKTLVGQNNAKRVVKIVGDI
jgi:flagellar motor switch protein FliM